MAFVSKWFGFGRSEDFDAGVRAYEAGRFEEAAERFRECANKEPDLALRQRAKSYLAGSLGRVGRNLMAQGDFVAAIEALGNAVAIRPRFADLHIALATAHNALGQYHKMHEEVRAALRINPRYGQAVLFEAALLMRAGRHGDGLARAVEAVSLDRRLENEEFQEGIRLADESRWDEAADRLLSVKPSQADDSTDLMRLGDAFMSRQRWADAEQAFRQALELAPGFADLHARRGQSLLELDRLEDAMEEFREAVAQNPGYSEAHALLGIALRRAGREEEAKGAFRAALEADPANTIASRELMRPPR
ncbi:MAG: tetratricopeptide repeat protein [Fimbriimonadaceae bacterium]|nr:tetratricopeptide repeat protein [Fimbriimonadaceae bacterium]QYK58306.1 MAG: tetratricopeptide repeat protein [Fimbriimonadaceae bacterium]